MTLPTYGSSLERGLSRRSLLASLGALTLLAGCQVSPLYSSGPAGGAGAPTAHLGGIIIDPPADRITQQVRNELVFAFGSGPQGQQYRLALLAVSDITVLGVSGTGAAIARRVRVTATYQLFAIGSDDILATNTVFASASYDNSEQRFANQRAAIDAEARAARDVAATIQAQLASAMSSAR